MARSVNTIVDKMKADLAADPVLSTKLTSTSLTAIYRLWMQIWARAANLLEQIWDKYVADTKAAADTSPAANAILIQRRVLAFQYDPSGDPATNNLTILPDGSMGYATVNPAFNLVTRCAVDVQPDNSVNIRVAQGAPGNYTPIAGPAYTQLDDYLTNALYAGVNHNLISVVADKLYIEGTVYYKPGFTSSIQNNVETALNAYIDKISSQVQTAQDLEYFEGKTKVSDIIRAIRNANGVDDVDIQVIKCRPDATAFGSASVVYDIANGIDRVYYRLTSGYAVEENTPGSTWADKLKYKSA